MAWFRSMWLWRTNTIELGLNSSRSVQPNIFMHDWRSTTTRLLCGCSMEADSSCLLCLTCTTGIHVNDKYVPGAYDVRSSPGVRLDMAVVFCCACSLGLGVSFHIQRTRVERGQSSLESHRIGNITFLNRSLNIINK